MIRAELELLDDTTLAALAKTDDLAMDTILARFQPGGVHHPRVMGFLVKLNRADGPLWEEDDRLLACIEKNTRKGILKFDPARRRGDGKGASQGKRKARTIGNGASRGMILTTYLEGSHWTRAGVLATKLAREMEEDARERNREEPMYASLSGEHPRTVLDAEYDSLMFLGACYKHAAILSLRRLQPPMLGAKLCHVATRRFIDGATAKVIATELRVTERAVFGWLAQAKAGMLATLERHGVKDIAADDGRIIGRGLTEFATSPVVSDSAGWRAP